MSRQTRRAFVTGIGGQDGSYLAEQLLAQGCEVHGLVRGSTALRSSAARPAYVPEAVRLHVGDITDHAATRALLAEIAPTEVYHLAAMSSVARSWAEPELARAVNGDAATALLGAVSDMSDAGDDIRFVQASSAEIFGAPSVSPQDESTPIAPTNPYGEAKAAAHLAVGEARTRGTHASSLVLYNHESPRRPPAFVTRKITAGVAAIAKGDATELVLGNLDARRDWGWAPDYVDALVRAARAEVADDYVIATGVGHTVREFVAAAFAAAGIADWAHLVRVDPEFFRPVDATELVGDATRARERLGWAPTVGFTDVVARMVAADLA